MTARSKRSRLAEIVIVRHLSWNPHPLTAAEIARLGSVSRHDVYNALVRMERDGFVARIIKTDWRSHFWHLTRAGKDLNP